MPPVEENEELEETVDNEEVEEGAEENEESEEEIEEPQEPVNQEAQALWNLLNNPATAKSTLNTIASNLGLTVAESKTEEAQKAIRDVIKEALGEDLAFLGDKLGPLGDAIEAMINGRISKAELKINESHMQRESARNAGIVDNTMKELNNETKGEFNSLLPKINKLIEEIPIGKQTPDQYLRRLYGIAKSEAASTVKKPSQERVDKAARESTKASKTTQSNTERVKEGSSANPSYREAIEQAIKDANRKRK